jgi:hypothetical protein
MKLYIPEIGSSIRLIADWTFDLYNESRNSTLMEFTDDPREESWRDKNPPLPCTIPAGSVLKIDRIYIRKGKGEYSSITFLWTGMRTDPRKKKRFAVAIGLTPPVRTDYEVKIPARPVRFWAKLDDVNKIEFDPV